VEIPFDPTTLFRGAIFDNDVDDPIEKMVHVALTARCQHSLAVTADTPLALFLICNQEDPMWQQCQEDVCDITSL
jgi:hypothetical protein